MEDIIRNRAEWDRIASGSDIRYTDPPTSFPCFAKSSWHLDSHGRDYIGYTFFYLDEARELLAEADTQESVAAEAPAHPSSSQEPLSWLTPGSELAELNEMDAKHPGWNQDDASA